MNRVSLLAGWLLAAASPALAAAPRVEVALSSRSATVGDPIEAVLTLHLDAAPRTTPIFPDWSHGWGEAEVRHADPPATQTAGAGFEISQRLVISAYRTGEVELPPVAVRLDGAPPVEVTTPSGLSFEIRSVLPEDPRQRAPKPPAPPVALPLSRAFWWSAGALAAAALVAGLLLHSRRRAAASEIASSTPEEELERALALLDPHHAAAAHAALSLALRRFLGRKFRMPAAESTTSELQRRLGQRGLPADLVRRIARLLRQVDQIKFALEPPAAGSLAARQAETRQLARSVTAHLAPPPEVAA